MHSTVIHVRWAELDPYNHVNHATYLSYLEHARISALESIGWGMDALADAGFQVVVAQAKVRFRAPTTAGETLRISTWVDEIRSASSHWGQRATRGPDLILEAEIRAAFTNLSGRPTRLPEGFRQALTALLPPPG